VVTDVLVLAPTRGRPERAAEMVASFRDTVRLLSTNIILVVDRNDPRCSDYLSIPGRFDRAAAGIPLWPPDRPGVLLLDDDETGNLVKATNSAARRVWHEDLILGHVGDDHLFRTPGWDIAIRDALIEPGVAYGNDGTHGDAIPTGCFISASVARSLGWLALPTANHLYIDNAWKTLGERLGALHYLPKVLIEHMHPAVGKAQWDTGYELNNSHAMYAHDRAAYQAWLMGQIDRDIERVRAAA
jgi:hypothetical protein